MTRVTSVTFHTKNDAEIDPDDGLVEVKLRPKELKGKRPSFGLVDFIALKILFFDVLISAGDVVSDFAQGYTLYFTSTHWIYGLVTLAINWLPGIGASIHVVSMYRAKLTAKKTIAYAVLLTVFYPVMPLLGYIFLLWNRPKKSHQEMVRMSRRVTLAEHDEHELKTYKRFQEAEYFAMMAHAISGGIESPIQFILQVWLILNGKVEKPWEQSTTLTYTDWSGNKLHLPTTAAISLLFSMLSMAKAIMEFNIIGIHIGPITTMKHVWKFIVAVCDHLPFFALATYFRLASIALSITYLNDYGFLPVAACWVINLVIGYKNFQSERIPIWLISFISIFFPVCFNVDVVDKSHRKGFIKLQYKTFWLQTLTCAVIYTSALVALLVVINIDQNWGYDPTVILNNLEFNCHVCITILTGVLSVVLAAQPNLIKCCTGIQNYIAQFDPNEEDEEEEDNLQNGRIEVDATDGAVEHTPFENRTRCCMTRKDAARMCFSTVILWCFIAPVIIINVTLFLTRMREPYVYHLSTSDPFEYKTSIIKAVSVNGLNKDLHGCLVSFEARTEKEKLKHKSSCRQSEKIVRLKRSQWPNCIQEVPPCYENATAIIIVDDNRACEENNRLAGRKQFHNCYRPSFSLTDLTWSFHAPIPMVLLQGVDNDHMMPKDVDCENGMKCIIHIAQTSDSIEEIPFSCQADGQSDTQCLPKKGQPLIKNDRIHGKQARSVTCKWGDRKCFGFTNEKEWMDYCDEPNISEKFCLKRHRKRLLCDDTEISGNIKARTLRMYYDSASQNEVPWVECMKKDSIRECDGPHVPRWTKYTRKDESGAMYRYCKPMEGCYIEEEDTVLRKFHKFHNMNCTRV